MKSGCPRPRATCCPITRIDGQPVGNGKPGPLWQRMQPLHSCSCARNSPGTPAFDRRVRFHVTMTDTLFQFPCDFPLKVMGRRNDDFRSLVLGIVQKHVGTDRCRQDRRTAEQGRQLPEPDLHVQRTKPRAARCAVPRTDVLREGADRALMRSARRAVSRRRRRTRITTLPVARRPLSTSSASVKRSSPFISVTCGRILPSSNS